MTRLLSLAFTSMFGMGLSLTATASPLSYTAIDLGEAYADDLNAIGQVTGNRGMADGSTRAFITGPNGSGMTTLGTLGGSFSRGVAINDKGQVTGTTSVIGNGDQRAFITGSNGVGMTDLGIPPRGPDDYYGTGINNAGQVTGDIALGRGSAGMGFVTGPNGVGMRGFETNGWESAGWAINNIGQVVGSAATGSGGGGPSRAFITAPNGTDMILIEQFDGVSHSSATAINDSGQAAGIASVYVGRDSPSSVDKYDSHVFITGPNGVGMIDRGKLIDSDGITKVEDINNAGQIVGWFGLDHFHSRAFLSGPDGVGLNDLNALIDLPGDTYFSRATGINDRGQIVANASDGHAYLLSPVAVPEPETMPLALTGLGLIGFMTRRRRKNQPAASA